MEKASNSVDPTAADDLSEDLAHLHMELCDLLKQRSVVNREVRRVRSEIEGTQRRIDILAGKYKGGRPLGAFTAKSNTGRVLTLLLLDRELKWSAAEIARELDMVQHAVASCLSRLLHYKRIVRVARGVYQAPKIGGEPQHEKRYAIARTKILEGIVEAIEAEPQVVWTSRLLVERELAQTVMQGNDVLKTLAIRGLVIRVRRGIYVHAEKGGAAAACVPVRRRRRYTSTEGPV